MRNHPYNNSIRPNYITTSTNDENALNTNSIAPTRSQEQQSQSLIMTAPIESSNKINRNSSSNAILAQLKSISPNFKSIFVRPKNSKYVDSSSLLNKSKLNSKNVILNNNNGNGQNIYSTINSKSNTNSMSSILNLLYNSSSSKLNDNNSSSNSKNILSDPSKLINMLPSIQPKELRLNSSVDELLRKFNTESM